ncbi:hypothetical protein ACFC1R_10680 [Kitasatospora sp. NPDC056138]|uniref:LppU/SCO3897 family protein n=1 Tax=Kitasatospora sp. NPDC056138 TaxID=3345724 RepID=UPI0035DD0D89
MRFCIHCGQRFEDAVTRFCTRCGNPRQAVAQTGPARPLGARRVRVGSAALPLWLVCLMVLLLAGGGVTAALVKPSSTGPARSIADSPLPPSPWSTYPDSVPPADSSSPAGSRSPSHVTTFTAPTPTPTPTTDPVQAAQVGQCFGNTGTEQQVALKPTECGSGGFQVVRVFRGTTDRSSCDSVPRTSWAVSYDGYYLVLCLSYQYPHSTAYYATQGNCVYGTTGQSDWNQVTCQKGNFTVLARYSGTTDTSKCNSWTGYDRSEYFTVSRWPSLNVLLCLTMNYPDAMGHATKNECLYASGPDNAMVFRTVGSCGEGNVVVTGRTSAYDDTSFCGNDGWATWRQNDYPTLSYTVCFRRL